VCAVDEKQLQVVIEKHEDILGGQIEEGRRKLEEEKQSEKTSF